MDADTLTHSLVTTPGHENPRLNQFSTMASANASALERELDWLAELISQRLNDYFVEPEKKGESPQPESSGSTPRDLSPPNLCSSALAQFIDQYQLSNEERLIFILALTPFIRPQLFDVLLTKNTETNRGFTEFGGQLGHQHGGFLPTVETALFIYAGDNLAKRFYFLSFFNQEQPLIRHKFLQMRDTSSSEPWLSSALQTDRGLVDELTSGNHYQPEFGVEFPAQKIHTRLDWDHLVLPHATLTQLDELRDWIIYGNQLLDDWEMRDKLSPGFTSLFYGSPGTGKTLSACLLGKYCDCDVYRVDLSMMVSKYIGETEKNLAKVFDAAENRQWILFFDEADALFGKRTKVDDSRDRYANQEISFLLQRIEDFNGVVILASNFKSNIDDAFIRRFQSVVHFPIPKTNERLQIWQNAFSSKVTLEPALCLAKIAEKYDVSGGTIMNVVRFASLRSLARKTNTILRDDIEEGLRRELLKEGRRL